MREVGGDGGDAGEWSELRMNDVEALTLPCALGSPEELIKHLPFPHPQLLKVWFWKGGSRAEICIFKSIFCINGKYKFLARDTGIITVRNGT